MSTELHIYFSTELNHTELETIRELIEDNIGVQITEIDKVLK